MVRGKDPFWEYVEDLENGRFSCNFCKQDFAGGISRIKSHLSGVSGRDIKICGQVPKAIQLEAKQALPIDTRTKRAKNVAIDTPTKRAKNVVASNNVLEGDSISGKGQDKSMVDQNLAKLLMLEGISPTVIQSPYLFDFVKGVAEHGPGYKLPDPLTLEYKLMRDIREEVKEYIQIVKNFSVKTGYTLMYNGFSHGKKFVDIFAYTPIGVVSIDKSFTRSFENSLGFEKSIPFIMELIGPTNVVQFITNNDIDEGILSEDKDMLCKKYPWIYQTRCPADGIELLLRKIYNLPYVYTTVQVAKCIALYISKHDVNVSLRTVCKRNDFVFSNVLILISILEVESKLQTLEKSIVTLSSDWGNPHDTLKILQLCNGAKFIDYVIHCKEFWSRVKMVAQVMQPLIQARYLVDCDDPTSGYLYELMERVQDAFEQFHNNNHVLYDDMCKILKEVRSDIIYPIHGVAAFLNPIYMCSEKFKENDEMTNGVNHVLEHLVAVEEKKDFMNQVQLYRMKDSNVFTAQAMEMLKTCHPRVWWERCGNDIPVLQKCAIRILSQPCSSLVCKLHYELCKRDNYAHLLNTIMMERCKSLQAQRTEPIIIDKLVEACDVDSLAYLEILTPSEFVESALPYFTVKFINNIKNDPTGSWIDRPPTGSWIIEMFDEWSRFFELFDESSDERIESSKYDGKMNSYNAQNKI